MLLPSSRPHGFTLAELSVILAVIGVLSAIAIPSFLSWYQSKQLDDAFARVENALRESQQQAIKRSRTCTVNIPKGINQRISGDCLITGDRPLNNIQIQHTRQNPSIWKIQFDFKGRNRGVDQNGTILLSVPGQTGPTKCLVISNGIGLMRGGIYEADQSDKKHCSTP